VGVAGQRLVEDLECGIDDGNVADGQESDQAPRRRHRLSDVTVAALDLKTHAVAMDRKQQSVA
jgi:hypothetical protein